jgi:8-oxo-dGTP pyrophosphatase MutT (NUDIX family)
MRPTLACVRTREVFVFVRRGEEFLVLRRSERQGGYWHGVAGGIEAGETSAHAAARELREETGLEATPVDLGRSWVYELEDWEPRFEPGHEPVRVDCYLADAPAGWEPELDWEHDEHRWCSPAEAAALFFWPEPGALVRELA